jgi:hypothetical protein
MDKNQIKQLLLFAEPILPMIQPSFPEMIKGISSFIPEWMKEISEKHNKEKVVIILDTVMQGEKMIAVIKFMTPVNGKLEPLKKDDGSPYIEPASRLLSDLLNKGLEQLKKIREEDD